MFAVVKTGGKQYRVAENDVIRVERLPGEVGERVSLDQVLMMGDGASVEVGSPTLAGKAVEAEILEQARGDKIVIFKRKRRKGYRRKKGHRQELTVLRITGIGTGPKAAKEKSKPKAETAADKGDAAEAKTASDTAAAKPAAKKSASAKRSGTKKAAAKSAGKPSTAKKTASKSTAKKATATKSGTGGKAAASKSSSKASAKTGAKGASGAKSGSSKSASKKE